MEDTLGSIFGWLVVGGLLIWFIRGTRKKMRELDADEKKPRSIPPLHHKGRVFLDETFLGRLPKNQAAVGRTLAQFWQQGLLNEKLRSLAVSYWDAVEKAPLLSDKGWPDKFLELIVFNLPPDLVESFNAGGDLGWSSPDELLDDGMLAHVDDVYGVPSFPGALFLGHVKNPTNQQPVSIKFTGDSHVLMVAPAGAGKGQRFILPNLMSYNGPLICLDPKGENYEATAWQRNNYGQVFKFAPFDPKGDSDCFNPLDFVKNWDDARALTGLLVVPGRTSEPFWDREATRLISSLILYLKIIEPLEHQNLRHLYSLLSSRDLKEVAGGLDATGERNLQDMASVIRRNIRPDGSLERQFTSILQTALSHLEIWGSDALAKITSSTSDGFNVKDMAAKARVEEQLVQTFKDDSRKTRYPGPNLEDGVLESGTADSVFVIIPPDRIREYAAALRVLVGWNLKMLLTTHTPKEQNEPYRRPFLFLCDEFPQLGYMEVIENAVAIARGYDIRLWLIAQDLSQLKAVYPQWESLIGNCQAQIFFGLNDLATAEFVSRRLGVTSGIDGSTKPLAAASDLTGPKFVDKAVMFIRGKRPIRAYLDEPFYEHHVWADYAANNKKPHTEALQRRRSRRAPDGESQLIAQFSK